MRYLSRLLVISLLPFIISSCATNEYTREKVADHYASENGFEKKLVRGGSFWITTFQKISNPKLPFVIYIEGDGRPFIGRYRISDDPTPRDIMLLELAVMDKRPNVVYMARPCQYTPMNLNPICNQTYWTDKRMSEDSIFAMNEVVKNISGKQLVDLIGFSGGGGVAVLIAARNPLVHSVVTLAGNLDIVSFNKYHKTRPMIGSLNPIDYAHKINNIPQLHLSGGKDKIVPAFIADDFVKAAGSTKCVKREIISNASHTKNWSKDWNYVLNTPVKCY